MPTSRRSRLPADALLPRGSRGGVGRIWIPWLLAPLFSLTPIAGCALAGKVRQAASPPVGVPEAPPGPPQITFEPPATGGTRPVVPVAPVAAAPAR